jgi:hypothetical protein
MHEVDWVKCSERLPDTPEIKLVTVRGSRGNRYVVHAAYIDGFWYCDAFEPFEFPIIAWADWPEPWDGEA